MKRVSVKSKLTVVSSKPTGSGPTHALTGLDQAMESYAVHMVFYYKENPFGSFEMDPMRESLSEVLSEYPTVTGRLSRGEDGQWVVRYNDAGVRVTIAKVAATLEEWLSSADSVEEMDLAAVEDMPHDPYIWSHFRLQINEFEGGGAAIGVSFSHLIGDPTSAALLMKSWADTRRGLPVSPPFFTHPSLSNSKESSNSAAKSTHNSKSHILPVKMASATFKFSNSTISQSLSQLNPTCPTATPFDFLAALFWTRICTKRPLNEQHNTLSICTDARKLLESPVSDRYFGNALHFMKISMTGEEMDRFGVEGVADLLNQLLESQVGLVQTGVESEKSGEYTAARKMYGAELTCVCMEQMMYAAEFVKNGKPEHVSCSIGNIGEEGVVVVMAAREGGMARNVTVTLPEKEMKELCEDEGLMRLRPTVVLSGCR